jgi:DNA polymerase-1
MRLQAHDELVLEAPKERAEAVPLEVEVGIGEDWLSAKG